MFFRRRKKARRSGGRLLVTATLVICVLLVVNRILAAFRLYRVIVPASFDYPKVRTIISVLAMVGLLLPEWWLMDWSTAKLKSTLPLDRSRAARHGPLVSAFQIRDPALGPVAGSSVVQRRWDRQRC